MTYPRDIEERLGFSEVRTMLRGCCISGLGAELVDGLRFSSDRAAVERALSRVGEVGRLLEAEKEMPGEDFVDLRPQLRKLRVEGMRLEEQELWELRRALDTLHSWLGPIRSEGGAYPALEEMAAGVLTFGKEAERIDKTIDCYGHTKDTASRELARLRNELRRGESSVNYILIGILDAAKKEGLVESHVMPTVRDGRLMLPVPAPLKRRIPGIVHDESATGRTVFIEPTAVVEANNRIRETEAEERREVARVLLELTDALRPCTAGLERACAFMGELELALAKRRLGEQLGAVVPRLADGPAVDWTQARHPLLELSLRRQGRKIVPLDIELTGERRMLIISGPNAGGKSVCLKTVGLLQYMLQCGLPVTAGQNSRPGVFGDILADIGDQQSIADDISTYSGHLLNMKNMMRHAGPGSLLLIDEFGSGTEPTIGGAMARAVLTRLVRQGAYGVITTHYQSLKQFAAGSGGGVANGAMLYDRQRMEALFQLQIGNPGSSFAVEIARKTGIPEDVLADAAEMAGSEYMNADKYLLDIARDKRYWESKRQAVHERERELERAIARYESEMAELRRQRKDIIQSAKEQAERLISESRARIESTIKEIREAAAEKERTRELRQGLEAYRAALGGGGGADRGDEAIERKMRQIEERRRRRQERKSRGTGPDASIQASAAAAAQARHDGPVRAGDTVRIKGQSSVGTVQEVNGSRATVLFGLMRAIVDIRRLERATPPERKDGPGPGAGPAGRQMRERIHRTQAAFSPDIDIRGMRADEALRTITRYIDDAILVGAARVRILHGTGTGALRQLMRSYLATVPQVSAARDEHVQLGGAGITVVEFTY